MRDTMTLLFPTTLLLLSSTALGASFLGTWPTDIEVRPNTGETVLTAGVLEVLGPFVNPTVIYVESDVPVVAERLTAGSGAFLEAPIPWNSALVIVKSSGCAEGIDIQVDITNSTIRREGGLDYELTVTTTNAPGTSVLDSSALFRQFGCFDQVWSPCEGTPVPTSVQENNNGEPVSTDPEKADISHAINDNSSMVVSLLLVAVSTLISGRGGRGSMALVGATGVGAAFLLHSSSTQASTPDTTPRQLQIEECTVAVEIAYWGCRTVLNATAPSLELRNMRQQSTVDPGTCNCTSLASFPDLDAPKEDPVYDYWGSHDADNNVTTDDTTFQVPTASSFACFGAVGRPFRDQDEVSISSKTTTPQEAAWSEDQPDLWMHYHSVPPPTVEKNLPLAQEWMSRAIGEHASVASFSAFTIALMSNGAPPALIDLSLEAAQDELRHAQISFQVASQFLGEAVEPSPLPPSQHQFGNNLTALAMGVLDEGCIDETLSALQMAVDYDEYHSHSDAWMWNITKQIAWEEARHSMLAWRTLQWICRTDEQVCSGELLHQNRLLAVVEKRHALASTVYRAWKSCLAPILACDVTAGTLCFTQECQAYLADSDSPNSSHARDVVKEILDGVASGVDLRLAASQ